MTKIQALRTASRGAVSSAFYEEARVQHATPGMAVLRRGAAIETARIAASCLLQPEIDDLVLAADVNGTVWVLAVLERAAADPAELHAPTGLRVTAPGGAISLEAGRVKVRAGETIMMEAPQAHSLIGELTHTGGQVTAHVKLWRHFGEIVETIVGRMIARASQSFRFVEGLDQLRSQDIDHRASGSLSLHADSSFITAEAVVKLDANQIHMG